MFEFIKVLNKLPLFYLAEGFTDFRWTFRNTSSAGRTPGLHDYAKKRPKGDLMNAIYLFSLLLESQHSERWAKTLVTSNGG